MNKTKETIKRFLSNKWRRTVVIMLADMFFVALAYFIARSIFFNSAGVNMGYYTAAAIENFLANEIWIGAIACVIIVVCLLLFDSYNTVWKMAGRVEFLKILAAYFIAAGLLFLFGFTIVRMGIDGVFPAMITIMFLLFSAMFSSALRYSYSLRNYLVHLRRRVNYVTGNDKAEKALRTIVIGAGFSGNAFLDRCFSYPEEGNFPVALIDEDPEKIGHKIRGVIVAGGMDKLEYAVKKYRAEAIVIAIVNLEKKKLKRLYTECRRFNLPVRQLGAVVGALKEGSEDTSLMAAPTVELKDIKIEELLGRDEFTVNRNLINGAVKEKVVLVTGGAGSIGSELCRQSLKFGCTHLIIYDHHENGCFELNEELKAAYKADRYTFVVGSVRDEKRLDETFAKYKPNTVFHAAAYKHVPMMEISATEAIKNNVFGTLNVMETAQTHGVKRFVFISTDKAVNPANIMGASKRIAEMLVQTRGKTYSGMQMAAVRFGNVLGSNGSVIPTFLKQIKAGGPITVTHKEIKRYFMTIPEAVRLVLQAGSLARDGDVFVLDMGEPVYIYDLAKDIIKLNGLEPEKDIAITFTGLRPGEKMFEELCYSKESVNTTAHDGIFVTKLEKIDNKKFADQLDSLKAAVDNQSDEETTLRIFQIVPSEFRESA